MADIGDPNWEREGLKRIEEFEAWQDAQIRKETWTPVGEYRVMIKTKKGSYRAETLTLHKNPDGNLGYSYNGFGGHVNPIPGVTVSSINRKTIDTLLVQLLTG